MDRSLNHAATLRAPAPLHLRWGGLATLAALPQRVLAQRWAQRWGMVLIVLALLAWLWSLFFWYSAQQKRALIVDRGIELSLMSSAVAQHSSGLLNAIGHDLRMLDVWLVTHPGADPLTDARFLALVDEMRRSAGGVLDIRMVSADGSLFYLPSADGQPRANVSDREYVRFHQRGAGSESRSMHVSAPVRSRVTERWDIPVSLRMTPPSVQGSAAPGGHGAMQVIFAAVNLERLIGEHERMRFKPDGAITLVRTDGIVLSRAPMLAPNIGQDLSASRNFGGDTGYGQTERGSFVSTGVMTDGVSRLVSFQRLKDFPITVLVSRSMDDIYSTFNARRQTTIALSSALSMIVLTIMLALMRAQHSQKSLRLMQENLRRLATTDELTGVANRRAFMESAEREFERAQRYVRPTALLMLDIDHFKAINDRYGHSSGDKVLKACASAWQASLREQDLLGRVGGEEFCILLPETGAVDAARIGERLRRLTAATQVLGGRCSVSVSIGWTAIVPTDISLATALERCDESLYAAKNGGRDCVRPALPAGTPPSESFFGPLPA